MGDYSFIKEVIKEKPINKKALLLKLLVLLAGAVIFGVVAALVFANALPFFQNKVESRQEAKVNIEEEAPPKSDIVPEDVPEEVPETQVVEVPAELGLSDYEKFYQDMIEVSENASKSVVTVIGITSDMDWFNNTYENQRQVSGLIIAKTSQELYVLTEYRGVENVDRIQVTFLDSTTVNANFQKMDPNTGLAVLKIPLGEIEKGTLDQLVSAPLGSSYTANQGNPIMALGSPMGYSDSIAFGVLTSVSNKVSTLDTEYTILTTDILGSKDGNGILLNLEGEIIGVILQQYSRDGSTVTAIGISEIKTLMETLSNNGELPYIGIRGQTVTADVSEKTGIPKGVYVNEVQTDSPGMLAGIMSGDVITKVRSDKVETMGEYTNALKKCKAGELITITAMRKGAAGYAEMVFVDVAVGTL